MAPFKEHPVKLNLLSFDKFPNSVGRVPTSLSAFTENRNQQVHVNHRKLCIGKLKNLLRNQDLPSFTNSNSFRFPNSDGRVPIIFGLPI